ncbi:MAG: hypothetical protein IJR14_05300 [Synergistaceae bacterium]|nr:hypothetical protein [Synergistaceae bacterium]
MRAYIPFDDGSSISFDGTGFTVHRRPVDIDADLSGAESCKAEEAWSRDWEKLVRALEAAWIRQRDARRREGTRRIYDDLRPQGDETP